MNVFLKDPSCPEEMTLGIGEGAGGEGDGKNPSASRRASCARGAGVWVVLCSGRTPLPGYLPKQTLGRSCGQGAHLR